MADEKITVRTAETLREFSKTGSMGVVRNTLFSRCYWPVLDEPTALFEEGSSGIQVQGPPTPRNVVFPPDTVFLNVAVNDANLREEPRWRTTEIPTRDDCFFVAEEQTVEVEINNQVTKQIEVSPGVMGEVTYNEKTTENRQQMVLVQELDRAGAEQVADVVAERHVEEAASEEVVSVKGR